METSRFGHALTMQLRNSVPKKPDQPTESHRPLSKRDEISYPHTTDHDRILRESFYSGAAIHSKPAVAGTKQQLTDWSSRLKRTPFKDETFVKMNIDLPNGTTLSYFVSTTEPLREVDGAGKRDMALHRRNMSLTDPKRYFVVPPGKWVDTI